MFHVKRAVDGLEGGSARTYTRPVGNVVSGAWSISYIGPLLAVVLGIVHAAIAPVIMVAGVKPNLVLIAVVLVTAYGGFLPGVVWAFVSGLTANLLVGEPLGSIPLAMLIVAALTAGGARLMGRVPLFYPVIAVLIGSVVADLVVLGLGQLVGDAVMSGLPTDLIVSAAVLNAVICAIFVVPARALATRYVADEATAW